MKSYTAFALAFAVAASAFAEPVLYCAGTVRYPSGEAAAGVRVEYYPGHHDGAGNYAETMTDTNGRYEILGKKDASLYWGIIIKTISVVARDVERNLTAIKDVYMTTTNVDLVLQTGITLSGLAKNPEGEPIADVEAQFCFVFGQIHLLEGRPVRANKSGQFSVSALPKGYRYLVYVGSAKGYGHEDAEIKPEDTWTNLYEFPTFVLKHANQRIAGRVLDENGKPFSGVEVSFSGKEQPMNSFYKWPQGEWLCSTKTDENGRFSFDAVCEGQLQVHADAHKAGGYTFQEVQPGDTNIVIRLATSSK